MEQGSFSCQGSGGTGASAGAPAGRRAAGPCSLVGGGASLGQVWRVQTLWCCPTLGREEEASVHRNCFPEQAGRGQTAGATAPPGACQAALAVPCSVMATRLQGSTQLLPWPLRPPLQGRVGHAPLVSAARLWAEGCRRRCGEPAPIPEGAQHTSPGHRA